MDPAELEGLVDRELRQLPVPRAPQTLLPRVMASVQQWTLRPWYARAWFTWPLWGQVASIAALSVFVACAAIVLPGAREAAAGAASRVTSDVGGNVIVITQSVDAATSAIRVVWRTLVEPVLPYAFAIVVLMCLACVAFGTAFNHLVLERALQR